MKRMFVLWMAILASFIVFSAFVLYPGYLSPPTMQQDVEVDLNMSDKVYEIVKTSCFDCHLSNSKNNKAKKAMSFDRISHLAPMKQIAELNNICEEIKEGNMPPEKYLSNFPDRKLTDVQIKMVCDWVKAESQKFFK